MFQYSLYVFHTLVYFSLFFNSFYCSEIPLFQGYHELKTIVRPSPQLPVCSLEDSHKSSKPILATLWKYSDQDSHVGFTLLKVDVTMKCHETFFGSEIKTIVKEEEHQWDPSKKMSKSDLSMIKDIREGTFSSPIPDVPCSWFSDNEATTTRYIVRQVPLSFSPSTSKLIHPSGFEEFSKEGLAYSNDRSQLLISKEESNPYTLCSIKAVKTAPGILLVTESSDHPIIVPLWKEMFYLHEQDTIICKKTSVYKTRGGYLLSYTWVKSDSKIPMHPPTSKPTKPALISTTTSRPAPPVGSGNVSLPYIRNQDIKPHPAKRNRREAESSVTNCTVSDLPSYVQDLSKKECPIKDILQNGLKSIYQCPLWIRSKLFDWENLYSQPSECYSSSIPNLFRINLSHGIEGVNLPESLSNSISSRPKRDLSHEIAEVFPNIQMDLTRSELQWGLYHLANATESILITITKELCHEKGVLVEMIRGDMLKNRINVGLIRSYYSDDTIRSGEVKNGALYLNRGALIEVALQNPLQCCGDSCLIEHFNNEQNNNPAIWLSSESYILHELSECIPPSQSIIFKTQEGVYLDVISNKFIHPIYSIRKVELLKPLEYSFDSSSLYNWGELYPDSEHIIIKNSSGVSIQHIKKRIGFSTEWWTSVSNFLSEYWKSFLADLVIISVFIIIVTFLLRRILMFKVRIKQQSQNHELELLQFKNRERVI